MSISREAFTRNRSQSDSVPRWRSYWKECTDTYGTPVMIEFAEPNPDFAVHQVEYNRSRSGFPEIFENASLDNFQWSYTVDGRAADTSALRKTAEDFARNFREWEKVPVGLYIHSRTRGSGKTRLACSLGNEIMKDRAVAVVFQSASTILSDITAWQKDNQNGGGRIDPVKRLKECRLLILDDLGAKQSGGGWLNDVLFEVMDHRITHNLVTVITSNNPVGELDMDTRIIDRVNAASVALKLPECSKRSQEANKHKAEFLHRRGLIP